MTSHDDDAAAPSAEIAANRRVRPDRDADEMGHERRKALAALALCLVLAIAHTWPLASAPGTLTRHDNADTYLNQWILAWIAHILPREPWNLFDANIFHPSPNSLAFSEHLIVQGVMGAPLAWLGASPVLVFNLVLLAGLTLTSWVTALVVRRWTGDWAAGLLAGSVAAFNTHTMSRLGHVQAMHVEFLPLALVALDRLLDRARVRDAFTLASWSTLQMLCSGYLLVFTAVTLAAGLLARPAEWLGAADRRRKLALLALAGAITTSACLPFLLPYATVRGDERLVRPLREVALYSASLTDYATTVANWHYRWWSYRFYRGTDALFPGVVPLVLATLAIATGVAWRDARARTMFVAGLVAFLLSFGPATPVYAWLYRTIPVFEGIRGAARFGYIAIVGTGVLAAFGLMWVRRRLPGSRGGRALSVGLAVAVVALVNLEALTAPHELTSFHGIPAVYDTLAREDQAVVAELPFWPRSQVWKNGLYVFNSTRHWKKLVNGYSGFTPESYGGHAETLQGFPDAASLALLAQLGVTHLVVHAESTERVVEQLAAVPELEQTAAGKDIYVYRLRPASR